MLCRRDRARTKRPPHAADAHQAHTTTAARPTTARGAAILSAIEHDAKVSATVRERRKRQKAAKKEREKWYEQILQALLRHVDFGVVKCVVLAGPGFVKDQW